ncbi:MAG TPA: RNA 2',3'-cyclic phosphodiesterase [Syntrophales bacterium]|nr:RNA 2',3'-cyclic phosphodiesterase [Syntrophales bacterium]HOL59050.1 RNA 2',3'-cyclic phosphodiesterase [Syntrophales bacterium]HPO35441.1 RNA 2',3'-cyclic phosphodiesterase [Syntrophales bacterium]
MKTDGEKKIRAFLAIDPPEHLRSRLEAAQKTLKRELDGAIRWVSGRSIHLTLKFFGNIEKREIDTISQALSGEIKSVAPLNLTIKSIGVFPHLRRPRVLWLGTGGDAERLAQLALNVGKTLERSGFPREERPFAPHWTLARINELSDMSQLSRLLDKYRDSIWGEFTAEELILFQSELTPQGAIYTPLITYKFGVIDGKQNN